MTKLFARPLSMVSALPCACAGLTNADQRITEDVEKFAFTVADLFSYTFKPLLDVILFTRSLGKIIGYKPQVHACSMCRQPNYDLQTT
jgi:ABC-type uncharacterized transport system fused permease/ATPase subunit